MAAYLPMVASVTRTGPEDAVVRISSAGTARTRAAWVRACRERRHLTWGTADGDVNGEVHVLPARSGWAGGCSVLVRLNMGGPEDPVARNASGVILDRVELGGEGPEPGLDPLAAVPAAGRQRSADAAGARPNLVTRKRLVEITRPILV